MGYAVGALAFLAVAARVLLAMVLGVVRLLVWVCSSPRRLVGLAILGGIIGVVLVTVAVLQQVGVLPHMHVTPAGYPAGR